jgi:hypothetical protein
MKLKIVDLQRGVVQSKKDVEELHNLAFCAIGEK